jgi:hypothetical protein
MDGDVSGDTISLVSGCFGCDTTLFDNKFNASSLLVLFFAEDVTVVSPGD